MLLIGVVDAVPCGMFSCLIVFLLGYLPPMMCFTLRSMLAWICPLSIPSASRGIVRHSKIAGDVCALHESCVAAGLLCA